MIQPGILLIAHGSKEKSWIQSVEHLAEHALVSCKLPFPLETAYLETDKGATIAEGVQRLERMNVSRILAIPLFVSSGSAHLEEIKYALGLVSEPMVETELEPVMTSAKIILSPAMDHHACILNIIRDRIDFLSKVPSEENLLLVAHGSDKPYFQHIWEETLTRMGRHFQKTFHFQSVSYATVRPNNITERAERLSDQQLIVVPLFLGEGYFTRIFIPSQLKHMHYVYDGQPYLPHPMIADWIMEMVNSCIERTTFDVNERSEDDESVLSHYD